jgi:hypothetical protein
MRRHGFLTIATLVATSGIMSGQSYERRAMIRGGSPDRGKCTVEIVVDGAADVEVRGDSAVLRNLSGQPPQWRRFECTGPLPANPLNFRFSGVDGRGKQELIRDPRNGGVAVVRIEDPDNGSEGYTFDLTWSGGAGYPGGQVAPGYPGSQRGVDPRDDRNRDDRNPAYRDDRNRDYYRDDDVYHQGRDDRFRGEDLRQRFFERIREDLDHVAAGAFPSGGDQYRLARTRQELDELQGKLAAGRYDQRELDEVIGAMDRVVRDNRLSYRDRDILGDDLNRLREFRARHNDYGAR